MPWPRPARWRRGRWPGADLTEDANVCLAVPGQVVQWHEGLPPFRQATVQFGEVCRVVSMECVPDAEVGDYVLVHAGLAISRIDAAEAQRVLEMLQQLPLDDGPAEPDSRPAVPRDGSRS